ncbi:uracil-DNA glycosylase [Hydrogenophaga palleronii]|uniref:Uracil-DNA glycosylase n=1 Tax=Hydrogenophaga palleronii TaxID=65655 RepID=A0ABU1WJV9_9BURK|nr:uracil-DNA glycosylase [Hydrogenophaga palleronii]
MAEMQGQLLPEEAANAPGRLAMVDPASWQVDGGWAPLVRDFWASPAGLGLAAFLRERVVLSPVYPPEPLRALTLAGPEVVSVVILGQDPYHGPGQAEGLAFSVAPGVRMPPSLRNIYKELQRDNGTLPPAHGSLVRWAEQGVLLLNTCLTVEEGLPASHAGRGWEVLTDAVIRRCSDAGPPKVFLLWGAHAQKKLPLIDPSRHLVLCANHPSPLSASRGPVPFLGCGHFSRANLWLVERGRSPVRW